MMCFANDRCKRGRDMAEIPISEFKNQCNSTDKVGQEYANAVLQLERLFAVFSKQRIISLYPHNFDKRCKLQ